MSTLAQTMEEWLRRKQFDPSTAQPWEFDEIMLPADQGDAGQVEPGNVDLTKRDKQFEGLEAFSPIPVNFDDGTVGLIPTVANDGRVMSNEEAIAQYQATGKHLGIFKSADHANAYAADLHGSLVEQDEFYSKNPQADESDFNDYKKNKGAWNQAEEQDRERDYDYAQQPYTDPEPNSALKQYTGPQPSYEPPAQNMSPTEPFNFKQRNWRFEDAGGANAAKRGLFDDLPDVATAEKPRGLFDDLPDVVQPQEHPEEAFTGDPASGNDYSAPDWLKKTARAVKKTASGFIPRSAEAVGGLLTPVVGGARDALTTYKILQGVYGNGLSVEEATRKHAPEQFTLADADKTPAGSQERYDAGVETLAQLAMAAGIAKGFKGGAAVEYPKETGPKVVEPVKTTQEAARSEPAVETETLAPSPYGIVREAPPSVRETQDAFTAPAEVATPKEAPTDLAPEQTGITHAAIDEARQTRNLDPIEKLARDDLGETWDRAKQIAAEDPQAGQRLAAELKDNPRALDNDDVALLLHRTVEARAEFDAATRAVNESQGDLGAMARLDEARAQYDTAQEAVKHGASKTGKGLRALQQIANEDFTLAHMEAEMRAAGGGQPLQPRHAAEVKQLHQKIADLTGQLEAKEEFKAALQTARKTTVKAFSPVSFLEEREASARARIIARRSRLYADPLGVTHIAHLADEAIIGAAHIARGVRNFKDWSAAMLRDFGDGIKPYLKALFARSQSLHSEAARLAVAKSRTVGATVQTLRKIGANNLTSDNLPPVRPDRELLELRANLQRAKDEFAKRLERQRQANMPMGRRIANTVVKAERAIKLTGITTLGKLGGAGVTRLVSSAVEEAVGGILSKIPGFRQIAEAAPREGGFSARAEVGALTTGLGRGIRNIPKILKGVRTNEDAVFGKQNQHLFYESGSMLDIPGRIHGAIKSPFKEAERERSTIKRQIAEERKGGNSHEPATEQEIGKAAYQDANRAIFMQDNLLSDGYRAMVGMMERNKKFPTAGFIGAKVANFLLPIVKVPTNVALETMTHLTGPASASFKLMQVMRRGLNTIKPEEADLITRHYKKGLIGAGLFLTGYFNAEKFGGFYQKGERRDPKDVRWMSARIAGLNIPAWLLHAPAFLVLQAGATFHRVMHTVHKGEERGMAAGTLAVAEGLVHEIPFMNEMSRLDKVLAGGYEGTKARGDLLRSTVVPQGVQNVAGWMDKKDEQGNPIRRSPKTELDYLKMGVPGLRGQVPYATHFKTDRASAMKVMTTRERDAFIQSEIDRKLRQQRTRKIQQYLQTKP